jgi:hypothetical protein
VKSVAVYEAWLAGGERCFSDSDPERSPRDGGAAGPSNFFDDPRTLCLVDVGE